MSWYRFFETIPALLAWLTLILMVVASRFFPIWAAVFIIIFDTYWFFKTVFLSFHLRYAFRRMRENLKTNWLKKLESLEASRASTANDSNEPVYQTGGRSDLATPTVQTSWRDIYHLVVLPMSTEPYEVVEETFESLSRMNYPPDRMVVVLGIEERVGAEGERIAERIKGKYGSRFYKFLVTEHPADIPGEIVGKGPNETWATKQAKKEIIDKEGIPYENILVSVFDADTQIYPDYFARLTYCFLTAEYPERSSYQPVPLYNNNIYEAPALARVVALSATFWHMLQQARPEKATTFSSHSMPFAPLVEIGFWETNLVSEDSRIFWQFYFHYDGDWRVVPLLYPVSMDANVAPTLWGTLMNVYKQQRRWGWGVENVPYILYGFMKNKKIALRQKFIWAFQKIEGFHSWATNALLIFALGWLPVILGGDAFRDTLLSFNLPNITRLIMTFASVGIVTSAILSMALLPSRPEWFKPRHNVFYVIQWVLLPVTMIVFGAFPAIDAQTRLALGGRFRLDFWITPKMRRQRLGAAYSK